MSLLATLSNLEAGYQLPAFSVTVTPKMVIMGATASRDWQPLHHDADWARQEAGLPNIILNNYTQAGWLCRYLTDWTGPEGRIGRMKFSMRNPICPGDTAVFSGTITGVARENTLLWLDIDLAILVADKKATKGSARLALPASPDAPSPWRYPDDLWAP